MKQLLQQSLLIGSGACSLASAGVIAADAPVVPVPPAEHQGAVWQERDYSFAFLGFTTTYSCDGLADKLKVLLLAAGARSDAQARPGACAGGYGRPDKFARAELKFYTLVPDTVEGGDAGPIDGIWRPVEFAPHRPRELSNGDCELVQQFKSSLLPLFSTRNVTENTTCIPNQESGSVIDLKFEALGAAPAPAKQPLPHP